MIEWITINDLSKSSIKSFMRQHIISKVNFPTDKLYAATYIISGARLFGHHAVKCVIDRNWEIVFTFFVTLCLWLLSNLPFKNKLQDLGIQSKLESLCVKPSTKSSAPTAPLMPKPLVYTMSDKESEPYLKPRVHILQRFSCFNYFCSHPDTFTQLRTYSLIHQHNHELQFILDMLHVCDYICAGFLNADHFFAPSQIPMLLAMRQLPRSIFVVNGRFVGSQVLPNHEPQENVEQWTLGAVSALWQEYCTPNARRQLRATKAGWLHSEMGSDIRFDLRQRIIKLVDILAVSYERIERLFEGKSVEDIQRQVFERAGDTHRLKSASLFQKWWAIRNYELNSHPQP